MIILGDSSQRFSFFHKVSQQYQEPPQIHSNRVLNTIGLSSLWISRSWQPLSQNCGDPLQAPLHSSRESSLSQRTPSCMFPRIQEAISLSVDLASLWLSLAAAPQELDNSSQARPLDAAGRGQFPSWRSCCHYSGLRQWEFHFVINKGREEVSYWGSLRLGSIQWWVHLPHHGQLRRLS